MGFRLPVSRDPFRLRGLAALARRLGPVTEREDVMVDRLQVRLGVVVSRGDVVYAVGSGLAADVTDPVVTLEDAGTALRPVGGESRLPGGFGELTAGHQRFLLSPAAKPLISMCH